MIARIRLALLVSAVVLLGVIAVLAFARAAGTTDSRAAGLATTGSPYLGALRAPAPSPNFRLRDQDGRLVSLTDFRGRPVIVTFLYSNCDDTCPAAARQIAAALDQLDEPVPTVVISVDPGSDTPAASQRFLRKMRLASRAHFLLGDATTLRPIWSAYGIQPQGEAFEHTAYVLVVDGQGLQRVAFPVAKLTPESLAHDVRVVATAPPVKPAPRTPPPPSS